MVNALNTAFSTDAEMQKAGLKATEAGGVVTIASTNNTYFRLNTGTSGASANLGFGVAGASFTSNLTAAAANFAVSDSNGASNTTSLSFAALQYGNDDQAITISANDTSGALQTLNITLNNDSAATRNGRSIDEAVAYINSKLQQSNNATLQKIVAVKENVGGTAEDQLPRARSAASTSAWEASAAPTGIRTAGRHRAAVDLGDARRRRRQHRHRHAGCRAGGGERAGRAPSPCSAPRRRLSVRRRTSSATRSAWRRASRPASRQPSRASATRTSPSEAANLTKAQVLQQASMAAMAQANSAPQAVLALLRG